MAVKTLGNSSQTSLVWRQDTLGSICNPGEVCTGLRSAQIDIDQHLCYDVYYVNSLAQGVAALFVASTWSPCGDDGHMFLRLPKRLPSIEEMLLQLGRPSPEVVAKALHVSPTTVRRWIKSGRTPRAAELAIYWLTHAGRADIEVDLHNEMLVQYGLARALGSEVERLNSLVEHLMVIGQFGAANEPSVRIGRQKV